MGLMKTLSLSSNELKSILDRLTALESGETFVTTQMFESLNQTVTTINTDVTNIKNGTNIENIMLANYPVGSIYFSADSENPSTKFGGTWVAWGAGRVPVGVGTGNDSNGTSKSFLSADTTGGEYTHKLTENELPASVSVGLDMDIEIIGGATGGEGTECYTVDFDGVNKNFTMTLGSDTYHNNIPPYITCYMWKRTA